MMSVPANNQPATTLEQGHGAERSGAERGRTVLSEHVLEQIAGGGSKPGVMGGLTPLSEQDLVQISGGGSKPSVMGGLG